MREHRITVQRTARYYSLGEPGAAELWIVCHGYAQLARHFLRRFSALADGTRYIVAPEALNRYYLESAPGSHTADARVAATWMTRESRETEIQDYVAYLDALHAELSNRAVAPPPGTTVVPPPGTTGTPPPRTTIALGFSQGAATVSRWAAGGAASLQHVVLWGGSLAHELEPRPDLLRGARLTLAAGDADPHLPSARIDAEAARLRAAGMEFDLQRYAGGHAIQDDALLTVARA